MKNSPPALPPTGRSLIGAVREAAGPLYGDKHMDAIQANLEPINKLLHHLGQQEYPGHDDTPTVGERLADLRLADDLLTELDTVVCEASTGLAGRRRRDAAVEELRDTINEFRQQLGRVR